jgi:hypothetical protein
MGVGVKIGVLDLCACICPICHSYVVDHKLSKFEFEVYVL